MNAGEDQAGHTSSKTLLERGSASAVNSSRRISAVDSLRGLAALAVLILHARSMLWIGIAETYKRYGLDLNINAWVGYLTAPFGLGWLGVTLFFVLSGYCIHRRGASLLAASSTATLNLKAFFRRRFLRIYPTYVAVLILTAFVDWLLKGYSWAGVTQQDNSLFTFFINLLSLQGYIAPQFGCNGVLWFLAVQIHLYLAYPLLFYISRKIGASGAVLVACLSGLSYLVLDSLIGIAVQLPYRLARGPVFLPYWFAWALGFYIAEVEVGRSNRLPHFWTIALPIVGVIGGFALIFSKKYEYAEMFWALFFAGVVFWSVGGHGQVFWGKRLKCIAFVGTFSYSLYATHVLWLLLFKALVSPNGETFPTLLPTLLGVLMAMVGAWLFFNLVERFSIGTSGAHGLKS